MSESRPRCAKCVHYFKENAAQGHCRRGPPNAFKFVIPEPDPLHLGKMQMREQISSAWPPVKADFYCGEHSEFPRWFIQHRQDALVLGSLEQEPAEGKA